MTSPRARGRDPFQKARAFLSGQFKDLTGLEDTSGVEILATIRALTRLCEVVDSQKDADVGLSGPRWGLLLVLLAHERFGKGQGLTPSALSHVQGVSRNTISSLLRGLEEQGYIERALDATDRRVFRIRLTGEGRKVVQSLAPARVAYANS
ncbi:MAG TPA: MarR family transcriptional regulator, partial [Anaerolineae bacterium]|nr:MarR family transcriptional regulator [Anaerolineae bacterium]